MTDVPPGFDGNCNIPIPTIVPLLAWCTLQQAQPGGAIGSGGVPIGSGGVPIGSGGSQTSGNVPKDQ